MWRMIGSTLALLALLAMVACNSVTGVSDQASKQEIADPGPGGGGPGPPDDEIPTQSRGGPSEGGEISEPQPEPGVLKVELSDSAPGGGGGARRGQPLRNRGARRTEGGKIAP